MTALKIDAAKSGRAALLLLPPTLLMSGLVLFGWGIDDLCDFFSDNVISILFVATRINREEKLLMDQFPEAYSEYRRHSWRLLPYVY